MQETEETAQSDPKAAYRESEASQYIDLHKSGTYIMGARRKADVKRLISKYPGESLLDVGTGAGETLDIAMEYGYTTVVGVDPAVQGLNIINAYAHDLPFEDKQFDTATCFDVLEHLIEDDIPTAIKELCRVASTIILSAATYSHIVDGRELHISRRPEREWENLIRFFCPGCRIERDGYAGSKSPAFVITNLR